jgi:hypothetical protein
VRAGFLLKPENLLGPVGVNGTRVLERIQVPELPVDEAFMYPETIDLPTRPGIPTRRLGEGHQSILDTISDVEPDAFEKSLPLSSDICT